MSTASLSDKQPVDRNRQQMATIAGQLDEAAQLDTQGDVDPAEALRIRRKIDNHILPLMYSLYFVQFMDKTTLGSSAVLGIKNSTHITAAQYNWLGTIFYVSYLIFEYPQNLALQRFPVGKWMSLNISIWAIALISHAACHNFGELLAVRFILGMCEGSVTAGFMIVSSMFYTRKEQTLRVGYWFLMNGTAQIVTAFISFGSAHIKTQKFMPWQWLMIITGIITVVCAVAYWFLFPDSPTTAWFLTPEERAVAISRLKENQTGVENKHFKKEQMMEALLDPKTWIFSLIACLGTIPNSLTNQFQIIISSFGFTTFQTTLLGCVSGIIEIVTIFTGVQLAARFDNSISIVGAVYFIPNILGSILVNVLPWSDKTGLLISLWITGVGTTGFVLLLSWIIQSTAGHTKRVTTNAIVLVAYCVGNSAGPQIWQDKYAPRNRVPWIIICVCYVICPILLLIQRVLLSRENRRRDAEGHDDSYDNIWIQITDHSGKTVEKKVDKAFLDLTDRQNRDFRYPL